MLTPRFKLTQDENHVFISIHAPYTNIGDTEIDVDGENFLFVSSPYFLRLRLPSKILDNDGSKGSYTCDSGDFNLTFSKENPGEHFENLDMITSLLAPKDIPDINPTLVEMLEAGISFENDIKSVESTNKFAYGFANKVYAEFSDIGTEFPQIFELKTPESVAADDRHVLRMKNEKRKFSPDHYLGDFYDEELLSPYLAYIPFWDESEYSTDFTDEEVALLKDLPNKHYLLSKNEYRQILLGLVDILFGYCYDKRSLLNDSTVESGWTINKLSSTLSWFCTFNDMKKVLIACYRRALIYPIFRNYDLCNKVKGDLVSLFRMGKKFVIKCMVDIHKMFNTSNDARYILNQLYIKDYLIFMQKCRSEELDELCNNIANIELSKDDLKLRLDEVELTGEMVKRDDVQVLQNVLAVKMASLSLIPNLTHPNIIYLDNDNDSDDSDSSSDSSDTSSEDSSEELDSDDDAP